MSINVNPKFFHFFQTYKIAFLFLSETRFTPVTWSLASGQRMPYQTAHLSEMRKFVNCATLAKCRTN